MGASKREVAWRQGRTDDMPGGPKDHFEVHLDVAGHPVLLQTSTRVIAIVSGTVRGVEGKGAAIDT
jgi:hypothetical protein